MKLKKEDILVSVRKNKKRVIISLESQLVEFLEMLSERTEHTKSEIITTLLIDLMMSISRNNKKEE